jgi:dimethylargininase
LIALTRGVSGAIGQCQLTHLARAPIDLDVARAQHAACESALEMLGCRVVRVQAAPDMADSVFIEDTAVVLNELAFITRPGAVSRRAETNAVADVLGAYRTLVHIRAPATMDGGDVMVAGRRIFVGLTTRTNAAALRQMQQAVEPYGYTVQPVTPLGCLHLKSAVTAVDHGTLLLNPSWIAAAQFSGFDCIEVHPEEPSGANIARVGARLLYASAFPRTRERIERRGYSVVGVDVRELAKAEGAVTCCSVIVAEQHGPNR